MMQARQKSCLRRSSSSKVLERKKSLIRIPSTSQIPKDFFRQPIQHARSLPENSSYNCLEITFMPNQNRDPNMQNSELKRSLDLLKKPSTAVKRVGRLTYEKKHHLRLAEV